MIDVQGCNIIRNARLVYTLLPGEKWTVYKGSLIVIHPERVPKIIYTDGSIKELHLR